MPVRIRARNTIRLTPVISRIPAYFRYSVSSSLGFVLFLGFVTLAMPFLVPCMSPVSGQSFRFADCTTTGILDLFVTISLSGFAVAGLLLFFLVPRHRLHTVAAFALLSAVSIIVAYHLFVSRADAAAAGSPIILDSLR